MPVIQAPKESLDLIAVLLEELRARTAEYDRLDRYFTGKQGERFVATGYRELFTTLFQHYAENICATVIEYVDDRLDLEGFRFPSADDVAEDATDTDAWRIWQDNQLDARSQLGHIESMVKGVSYVLVSPFIDERVGPGRRSPRITIEQPTECIVSFRPGGNEREAGLKVWFDAAARQTHLNLYLPDRIEKYEQGGHGWANQYGSGFVTTNSWTPRQVDREDWPLKHSLGVVPLIPLVNRPRLGSGRFAGIDGRSDIADVTPIQDAVNFIALSGIVAADKAAFPQKWATGVEIPKDPKTGNPIEAWKPDIDAILSTRAPDAKFGNFDVAELHQYDDHIRTKLEVVALQTRIPVSNFLRQTGQPASGEAREAADAGLTKRIERKQRYFGETWEEILRLAFRSLGDTTRGDDTAAEAEWAYAGTRPSAATVDALVKKRQALNVPYEVLWEEAGYSPTERRSFRRKLEQERKWLNSTPTERTEPDALPSPGAIPPVVELAAEGEQPIDTAGG